MCDVWYLLWQPELTLLLSLLMSKPWTIFSHLRSFNWASDGELQWRSTTINFLVHIQVCSTLRRLAWSTNYCSFLWVPWVLRGFRSRTWNDINQKKMREIETFFHFSSGTENLRSMLNRSLHYCNWLIIY